MKTCSSALATFLLNAPAGTQIADLYTITLMGGTALYYTTWPDNVVYNGHTFVSGPFIRSSSRRETIGTEVTSISLNLIAEPWHTVNGVPILSALASGVFDGADVYIERLYLPLASLGGFDLATAVSMGSLTLFRGGTGPIDGLGNSACTIQVNSRTEKLNQVYPKDTYGPGCRHTLFDAGCTLSVGSFTSGGTVNGSSTVTNIATNLSNTSIINAPTSAPSLSHTAGSGANLNARTYWVVVTYVTALGETTSSPEAQIDVPQNHVLVVTSPGSALGVTGWNVYVGLSPGDGQRQNGAATSIGTSWTEPITGTTQGAPPPTTSSTGYYEQGVLVFTSGQNMGVTRRVRYQTGGVLVVTPALPYAPGIGDTFNVTAGCDKQMSTCKQKFNNLIHFGGQPFIPSPAQGL